jgi:hypothetical protein
MHFKDLCVSCDRIFNQCRCGSPNKTVRKKLCSTCCPIQLTEEEIEKGIDLARTHRGASQAKTFSYKVLVLQLALNAKFGHQLLIADGLAGPNTYKYLGSSIHLSLKIK